MTSSVKVRSHSAGFTLCLRLIHITQAHASPV